MDNSETGKPKMDDDAPASASRRGSRPKRWEGGRPRLVGSLQVQKFQFQLQNQFQPGRQGGGPERNMAKPRKEPVKNEEFFFPPDQVVYATVQWVLKDYQNKDKQNKDNPRLFSPIVDDINAMGCTIPCSPSKERRQGMPFWNFCPELPMSLETLDLTRVSNVQMHLGAEMLHEVKQTVDDAAKAGII